MPNGPSGHKEVTPGNEPTERDPRHGGQERAESKKPPKLQEETTRPKTLVELGLISEEPPKPHLLFTFKEASPAISAIDLVQNEGKSSIPSEETSFKDKRHVLSSEEFQSIKELVRRYGKNAGITAKALKNLDALEPEVVVVLSQRVLQSAKRIRLEEDDFKHVAGSPQRRPEEALLRVQVKKVQDPREEPLTPKKVAEHLQIETQPLDWIGKEEPEAGGPGAMAAARPAIKNPTEMTFKEMLLERLDNAWQPHSAPRQAEIQHEILRRVHSSDPADIHIALKDLEFLTAQRRHNPALVAELNLVLDPAFQQELAEAKEALDDKYTIILDSLDKKGHETNLGDLDLEENSVLSGLRYGVYGRDMGTFEHVTAHMLDVAGRTKESPDLEGIRTWYALQKVEDVRIAFEIEQRTQIQADVLKNIESLYETMTFFSKSRTVEGFGQARQRIDLLLNAVEQSTDPRVTAEMKKRLRHHVESFQEVNPLFIVMRDRDGDPEAEAQAAGNVKNESFRFFYDRFSELKDKDGNLYLVDANGNRLVDANGDLINPLGESENSYLFKYMDDRFRMNQVEEMTRNDLNIRSANSDEQWLMKHILGLPQNRPIPRLSFAQIRKLYSDWDDSETKKNAVWDWHKQNTLLGVDGFEGGRWRRDVRVDEVMNNTFRDRLLAAGMAQDRIDALFEDYEAFESLKAVGENLAIFKYSSAMDRLRIFDKRGNLVGSVFGEETPFFEREVDHAPDFFNSEGHGDPLVNEIIRKKADEKYESFMNASNMRMYRLLILKGVLPQNLANLVDAEVKAEMDRTGKHRVQVEAYVLMDMIYEGFDRNAAPGTQQMDLFNINWAEASKYINSYTMNDNAGDRVKAVKFYREAFREFSLYPSEENFNRLMKEYYSARPIRKEEGADFFLEVYGEAGKHWKKLLDVEHNINDSDFEAAIDIAVNHNMFKKPKAEKLKEKTLGRPVVRNAKQLADFIRASAFELRRPGFWWSSFWDFVKTLMAYLNQK